MGVTLPKTYNSPEILLPSQFLQSNFYSCQLSNSFLSLIRLQGHPQLTPETDVQNIKYIICLYKFEYIESLQLNIVFYSAGNLTLDSLELAMGTNGPDIRVLPAVKFLFSFSPFSPTNSRVMSSLCVYTNKSIVLHLFS